MVTLSFHIHQQRHPKMYKSIKKKVRLDFTFISDQLLMSIAECSAPPSPEDVDVKVFTWVQSIDISFWPLLTVQQCDISENTEICLCVAPIPYQAVAPSTERSSPSRPGFRPVQTDSNWHCALQEGFFFFFFC